MSLYYAALNSGGDGLGHPPGAPLPALQHPRDARFCTDTLTDALERDGRPEIFNTDQGSQFTSLEFPSVLKDSGVAISMDRTGRYMGNIFIGPPVAAPSSTRPSTCMSSQTASRPRR